VSPAGALPVVSKYWDDKLLIRGARGNLIIPQPVPEQHAQPPEQRLAFAVLARAIEDISLPLTALRHPRKVYLARSEARLFCTGNGIWRQSRELWCDAAGVDPNAFRQRMMPLVEAAKLQDAPLPVKVRRRRRKVKELA